MSISLSERAILIGSEKSLIQLLGNCHRNFAIFLISQFSLPMRIALILIFIDNVNFSIDVKCQFLSQASELSVTMATLYSQSVIQLEEVTLYQTAALNTLTNTLSANATVQEYLDTMRGWNQSATSYLYDALARRDEVAGLTVGGQAAMIETELERSRNVSLEADALLSLVMTQVRQSWSCI